MLKKLSRALALLIVPPLGYLLIRFLYATNRNIFHTEEQYDEDAHIFACWHGELLLIPPFYKKFRTNPNAKILISPHFDGKLIAKTVRYFGLETLSGSSHKGPAKVLIQAIKTLKEGRDIGITPDGPKGPRHEVADGIIIMAQKTGKKVVFLNIQPKRYWQLHSWDGFVIPKPFGTIHYYASPAHDITAMEFEEARKFVQEGLLKHHVS